MVKRLYHVLALIALINLFALAGFVGYLFQSGRLNAERLDQIAVVLRGEFPKAAASQPAASQPAVPPPPQPSRAELARIQAQKEYYALIAERHQREMEDRRKLNETIQLDVVRKLEEIEREKELMAQQRRKSLEQAEQLGFQTELELYSQMEPNKAKELLRKGKDVDAARLIMKMDPGRAKKILNACKGDEELQWVGRILTQIRSMSDITANGGDGPDAASSGG